MTIPSQIWYSRSPVVSPLAVSVRTGRLQKAFADHGITLASTTDHADESIRRAYFDHHLEWSFRQGGNVPALWARSNGAKSRLIGLSWNTEFQAILTLSGTGIRNARDLTGRRFAVPHFAPLGVDLAAPFALKGLYSARAAEGLDISGIELVDIPTERGKQSPLGKFALGGVQGLVPEVLALVQGKVDAIYVKGVEGVVRANAIGAVIVSEFGDHPDPWVRLGAGNPRPLTIGEAFVRERPDLVNLLLDTIHEIGPWATANRDAAIDALAEDHKSSRQAVSVALGDDIGAQLGLSLRDEDLERFDRYKKLLLDWNILQKDFSLSDWIERVRETA
jgi:ABC-type nitrate/sulfonate/bicarbonate transport system substrate-binding protein